MIGLRIFTLVVGTLLWCSFVQASHQRQISIPLTARLYDYLKKYGYFDHLASKAGELPVVTPEDEREAIDSMMRMAGLSETDELDENTLTELLDRPRCGVKDGDPRAVVSKGAGGRSRRYSVLGDPYTWGADKTDLTYKTINYPSEHSSVTREEVDRDIREAFKVWSDVTPLTFTEIHTDDADIRLLFGGRAHTRVAGDPPFDGPGGTLAHAFTPNSGWGETDGDVHMDDDETFTHGVFRGTNLFYTLAHEIGHSLGMFHSDVSDSLMWPFSRGYIPNFQLPEDDILGIQSLYGPNPKSAANPNPTPSTPAPTTRLATTTEPAPTTRPAPVIPPYCETTFNAIAFIDNQFFMFGNNLLWRFDSNHNLLSPPEGQLPRDIFPKFPRVGVKAVYQEGEKGNVVVFKGKNYWVYEPRTDNSSRYQLKDVDPKTKTDFPRHVRYLNFPKWVSGVLHLADLKFSYVIKGKKVFTFDEVRRELSGHSVNSNMIFNGVSGKPTTAFFAQGFAHVLQGPDYYRFVFDYKNSMFAAINGYPKNFAEYFLDCPAAA